MFKNSSNSESKGEEGMIAKHDDDDEQPSEFAMLVFTLLEHHKIRIVADLEFLAMWRQIATMTFIVGQVAIFLGKNIAGIINLVIFLFAMWKLQSTFKKISRVEVPIIPKKVS